MPEISRFLGIIIVMYYKEHNPPHFHVRYNEHKAAISINNLALPVRWETTTKSFWAGHRVGEPTSARTIRKLAIS